jgi:DNA-binding transcriptional regulator YiaG
MGGLPASVAGLPVREHDKRIIMAPMLPVQCWIARAALGWSRDRLARAGGMSAHSVKRFEHGQAVTTSISEAIQRTLEKAGVVFIGADDGGPGARLK